MTALLLLKHIYNLSDEDIVDRWMENPYWQYFSGELVLKQMSPLTQQNLFTLEIE